MSGQLERELERVLESAAGAAPTPGTGFLTEVHDRRRGRQRVRVAGTGALVAVALVARRPVHHPVPQQAASAGTSAPAVRAPDLAHLRPVQDVWPGAVRHLPARLPDGHEYVIVAALGGGRYVIETVLARTPHGGVVARGAVGVLDAASGTVHPLGGGTSDRAYRQLESTVTVGGDRVVWFAVHPQGSRYRYDLWTARTGGGAAQLVATVSPRAGGQVFDDRAFAVGGWIYFSMSDRPGPDSTLYRVPAAGGTPEAVPGSTGFLLSLAPWAVGQGGAWWNLATGERTSAAPAPGATNADQCAPPWCLAGNGIQRMDGTGLVRVARAALGFAGGGRFVTGDDYVWDTVTGRAGGAGGAIFPEGHWSPGGDRFGQSTVIPLSWNSALGREHVVLDLTAAA